MNSFLNYGQIIYSLDTSALIAAFHERYPTVELENQGLTRGSLHWHSLLKTISS